MTDKADKPTIKFTTLDALPLFATDREIAVAVVGRARAEYWRTAVLPTLERRGFPAEDPLHTGRAVPLVKKFYEGYFGVMAGFLAAPGGQEKVWIGKRREKWIEDEERRRAAGEDVVERDPGTTYPETLKAIAEYRAKKAAEFAKWKAEGSPLPRHLQAKANSDAWAQKKRKALEDFRAKKAAEGNKE